MSKSFCSGCKHWKTLDDGLGYKFMACVKFHVWEADLRRKMCNGKYKEDRL